MNEDLARKLFQQSDFTSMQADILAKVLSEIATKEDLNSKIDGLETRLRAEIIRATSDLRVELTKAIAGNRVELKDAINDAQTQTMRWGIAMIIAMSSIFTLLDIFID